jgi:uncharacterized protein YjiS (DUF1127 family)
MCTQTMPTPVLGARTQGKAMFPENHLLSRCLKTIAVWMVRSAQRRALRELAQEGRLLADIGLNRQQALSEAAKPFWR